ncbi:MAG: hypothetical protein MUF78_04060 [Candidatus Edwardsbacteria bacterium]|nr:hypothetical protein [Candidatus Edwardsbacteria bacterium]
MKDCENLATCGFLRKHMEAKTLACQGFIRQYCKGDKQGDCKRRTYKQEHGAAAPDDMLPSGQMLAEHWQ